MIADKIENLKLYSGIDKHFTLVAEFLMKNDAETLDEGEYQAGDGVLARVSVYEPQEEPTSWETHRKYADLQYIVAGDEMMQSAPLSDMKKGTEYFDAEDYQGFEVSGGNVVTIFAKAGTFAYFAPGDAHMPGLRYTESKVKKIVFKLPV